MVDSQVTLQIGTELDLSGLQRDLAKLQSTKFDFEIDPNKLGRQFREANRQMVLTPKVDMKQLHDLNKLLDVKLKHYKQVQDHFNKNPLRVRMEVDKSGLKTADKSATTSRQDQGQNIGKGFSELVNQSRITNELLKQIANNTGSQITTGFKEALGAALFDVSAIGKGIEFSASVLRGLFDGVGKAISDEIPKDIKKGVSKTVEKGQKTQKAEVRSPEVEGLLKSFLDLVSASKNTVGNFQELGKAVTDTGSLFVKGKKIATILDALFKNANNASKSLEDLTSKGSDSSDELSKTTAEFGALLEALKKATQEGVAIADVFSTVKDQGDTVAQSFTDINKNAEGVADAFSNTENAAGATADNLNDLESAGQSVSENFVKVEKTVVAVVKAFSNFIAEFAGTSGTFSEFINSGNAASESFEKITKGINDLSALFSVSASEGKSIADTFGSVAGKSQEIIDVFSSLQSAINETKSAINDLGRSSQESARAQSQKQLEIPMVVQEKEPVPIATKQPSPPPKAKRIENIPLAPSAPSIQSIPLAPEIGGLLDEAFDSLKKISDLDLESTMGEIKASLESMVVDASKRRIKGEYVPDLRMVGKQLGIGTRNKETGKAYRKEELIGAISQFSPEDIQSAMTRVKAPLPEFDTNALKDLEAWYRQISDQIKKIDGAPIEEQKVAIAEVEKALKNATKSFAFFEKSFAISGESNKSLQGRKAAFDALVTVTDKIKSSWSKTGGFIEGEVSDLVSMTDDQGLRVSPKIFGKIGQKRLKLYLRRLKTLEAKRKLKGLSLKL